MVRWDFGRNYTAHNILLDLLYPVQTTRVDIHPEDHQAHLLRDSLGVDPHPAVPCSENNLYPHNFYTNQYNSDSQRHHQVLPVDPEVNIYKQRLELWCFPHKTPLKYLLHMNYMFVSYDTPVASER